jgi:16S rRNA (cytidine1402-2'-O)-methyltransferase
VSIGRLVLVATPIGNLGDLAPRAVEALRDADVICAEDTRRSRALMTHAGVAGGRRLVALHEHNERQRAAELVERIRRGAHVVYVTDAGMPGISDPGARLVRVVAEAGMEVRVVPGPSAVLAALVLSGLPTDRFAFEGFLPRKGADRKARLADIAVEPRTTVLFEAPKRLVDTIADLAAACGDDRPLAIAREITKVHEEVFRGTLAEALAHVRAVEPRGEHSLVLGGAAPPAAATDDEIVSAASAALDAGATARDAADDVAARLGISRRRAYAAVIAARDGA